MEIEGFTIDASTGTAFRYTRSTVIENIKSTIFLMPSSKWDKTKKDQNRKLCAHNLVSVINNLNSIQLNRRRKKMLAATYKNFDACISEEYCNKTFARLPMIDGIGNFFS